MRIRDMVCTPFGVSCGGAHERHSSGDAHYGSLDYLGSAVERSVVDDGDVDTNVAPGGIGVGAHLVGLVGELLGLVMRQVRDDDLESDGEAEPLPGTTDRDSRTHRGVTEILLRLAGDQLQGGVEKGLSGAGSGLVPDGQGLCGSCVWGS